ncbi:MAG: L-threonylcarbamoyladenylate synthase [Acidobacteriota bacterium]
MAASAVREVLRQHGVVGFPTETFYGLGADPSDPIALERVHALKRRAADKALPVVGASLDQLESLVLLQPGVRELLAAVWPAPLTVVLPARGALSGGATSLAVRVPDHGLLRSLLARVGPLTATSANRAGERPLARAAEVAALLGPELALLLDGGKSAGDAPSTLVDLTVQPPKLLRQGGFLLPVGWAVRTT